jgi:DNA polymerase III delta prime subunit
LDLQFKPPSVNDVKKLLNRVKETVNVYREDHVPEFELPDDHTLQVITDTCKGDIRQILNHIQLWYKKLNVRSVKGITQKDLDNSMNINDAALVLLNSHKYIKPVVKTKTFKENSWLLDKLNRLSFVDYDLLPYFFLENHLQLPGGSRGSFGKMAFMKNKFGSGANTIESCGFKKIR